LKKVEELKKVKIVVPEKVKKISLEQGILNKKY